MRVSFKKGDSSWQIELDGVSVVTWTHFSFDGDLLNLYGKISGEQQREIQKANLGMLYNGFSIETHGDPPTVVRVSRDLADLQSAQAEYAKLIEEMLSDGYVEIESLDGIREVRERLFQEQSAAKERGIGQCPPCINDLEPEVSLTCNGLFSQELRKIYSIPTLNDLDGQVFNPVQSMSYVGRCSTDKYWHCPNTPEWHLENAASWEDGPESWFENIGNYFCFDFTAVSNEGERLPLRVLFNEGDGDCNDGYWGEVWNLKTNELVANIESSGDTASTIEVVCDIHAFESQDIPILSMTDRSIKCSSSSYDNVWNRMVIGPKEMCYANERNLERIIGLAIRVFSAEIYCAHYPK